MVLNYDKNILLISIFIVITVFIALHQYEIVNIIFLLFCIILLLQDRKLLILIYIVLLPINGFIGTEYNLFQILHVSYIVNFITLLALIFEWNSFPKEMTRRKKKTNSINRYAYWLVIFLIFFLVFTDIRLKFLGMETISYRLLFTRTIRRIAMLSPLLILYKLSFIKKYKLIIQRGFLISVGLLALSIIFSRQLSFIGFSTQESNFFLNFTQSGFVRRAGIFTFLGDENSASGFLAIGMAYIIYLKNEFIGSLTKKMFLIIILLAIIATGSRMGFGSSVLIILIYFTSKGINSKQRLTFLVIAIVFVIIIFFTGYITPVLNRFSDLKVGEGHLDTTKEFGRLGGWLFYIKYIISSYKIILFGSFTSIYDAVGWSNVYLRRVAHNFFIQLWYFWGILPVIILIKMLFGFLKQSFKEEKKNQYISLFVPFFLTLFFVSDPAIFVCFPVALISLPDVK